MRPRRNQKGFTLMELMVVIVIVAILAAVAVPLYINYVKDAQRTEAKGAIAAIVTAEQVHLQRFGEYVAYDFDTPDSTVHLDVDVSEAVQNWGIVVTPGSDATNAFVIVATGKGTRPSDGLKVTYNHNRTTPPAQVWVEE